MLIAIDVDDVLADFIPSLIKFHNEKYNTSLTRNQIHSYRFWEVWGGTREEAIQKVKDYKKTHFYYNIQPTSDSIEMINSLKEKHKLIVVTSRSDIEGTKKWINKYFLNVFSEIYFSYNNYTEKGQSKTKADICKELNVDIIIEDSLEYAKECSNKGIKIILLDCPWNQWKELPENVVRVKDWNEVLKNI